MANLRKTHPFYKRAHPKRGFSSTMRKLRSAIQFSRVIQKCGTSAKKPQLAQFVRFQNSIWDPFNSYA